MSREFRHQASFALNVVMVITVVVLALPRMKPTISPQTNKVTPGEMTQGIVTKKIANETPPLNKPILAHADFASVSDRRRWIIDQLRAMGVPNDILALVACTDLDMQWESRFEQCHADGKKLAAVQLEMDMNKDAEMRAALGEEGFKQ